MSTFNKLFTGSMFAAALVALMHTGAWAWRSAGEIDAAQKREIAAVMTTASNGSTALASSAADSCARAPHASSR